MRGGILLTRCPYGNATGRKSVIKTMLKEVSGICDEVEVVVFDEYRGNGEPPRNIRYLGRPSLFIVLINVAFYWVRGEKSLNECLYWDRRRYRKILSYISSCDFLSVDMARLWQYARGRHDRIHVDLDDMLSVRYKGFAESGVIGKRQALGYVADSYAGLTRLIPTTLFVKLLRRESAMMARVELEIAKEADSVSLVSGVEARVLSGLSGKNVLSIPMSVRVEDNVCRRELIGKAVFVGGADYAPNYESLQFIRDNIATEIVAKNLDYKIHHVGVPMEGGFGGSAILISEGYVDDLKEFLDGCSYLLAPILSGTGIKTKIVEAMGLGLPVITSVKGVEGLDVEHLKHCFIAESPSDYIDGMTYFSNQDNALFCAGNALSYVRGNFSSKILNKKWKEVLCG
jgi:hypothetical protein